MPVTRDHKYMVRMLDTVMRIWHKNPHLRLGQLVAAAVQHYGRNSPIFYIEDDELIKDLERLEQLYIGVMNEVPKTT